MYKTINVTPNTSSVILESFYYDDSRMVRGYADAFTGVSKATTIPIPEWGDSIAFANAALIISVISNDHTGRIGFHLNKADYARLKECGYFD